MKDIILELKNINNSLSKIINILESNKEIKRKYLDAIDKNIQDEYINLIIKLKKENKRNLLSYYLGSLCNTKLNRYLIKKYKDYDEINRILRLLEEINLEYLRKITNC